MTELLRDVLHEHADTTPAPHVDLDGIIGEGERRVRRRRMTGGLAAASAVALVAGSGLAVQGMVGTPGPAPTGTPSTFGERQVSWATGDVIHWGTETFAVGRRIASYVQTDDGFVYTTPTRDVWFHDGIASHRIGRAGAGRLRTDDTGSLVAWVGADRAGSTEYVVYDTALGREVARVGDDAAGPAVEETDLAAEVFAVDDGSVYWRVDGDRIVRYHVSSGEAVVVHEQQPPADPSDKGPSVYELADVAAGLLAYLVDSTRGVQAKVAGTIDLDEPTVARASNVLLSPDGRYLAAEEDDNIRLYDVATREDVTPDLAHYPYAVAYGWVDEDTAMAFGIPALSGPGYDVDLLSCVIPSGTCEVVGETSVTDDENRFVIPTGDPMDT